VALLRLRVTADMPLDAGATILTSACVLLPWTAARLGCIQVSGVKSFVEMRGCAGRLEMLLPRSSAAHAECEFGRDCQVCDGPLAVPGLPATGPLAEEHPAFVWHVMEANFLLVCVLKVRVQRAASPHGLCGPGQAVTPQEMCFEQSAKALAPYVHRADGLMDVLAVEKTEDMDHLQLVKRCCQFLGPRHLPASALGLQEGAGGGDGDADAQAATRSDGHGDGHSSAPPRNAPGDPGGTAVRGFVMRKAAAVRLAPEEARDRFNVDGEVVDGRSCFLVALRVRLVLPRDHCTSLQRVRA